MNIAEMHVALDQEIDRISGDKKPDLNPAEKDMYLQKGIWIYIFNKYDSNIRQKGFETNQERIDSLRTLHVPSPGLQPEIVPTLVTDGIYKVDLSDLDYEYLLLTKVEARVSKDGCTKTIRTTSFQTDDRENTFSKSSFKWSRLNISLAKSNSSTSINTEKGAIFFDTAEDFSVLAASISYVKYPNRVFFGGYNHIDGNSISTDAPINCDIDAAFHPEIVRLAALEVMTDLGDPNFSAKRYRVETDQI
jgi:hypothetical protein